MHIERNFLTIFVHDYGRHACRRLWRHENIIGLDVVALEVGQVIFAKHVIAYLYKYLMRKLWNSFI